MSANGYILYEGNSVFDNKTPIVALATGVKNRSNNAKTGKMIQIYIIRQDMKPIDAVREKKDSSICGDCKHNYSVGERSCYVDTSKGPSMVYKAYKRGSYSKKVLKGVFEDEKVRFGAYGDPAAVPFEVWEPILEEINKNGKGILTSYTHAWKYCDQRFKQFTMASVDSMDEAKEAWDMGWRTYRVMPSEETPMVKGEFLCPGSDESYDQRLSKFKERGYTDPKLLSKIKKIHCDECGACNGGNKKSNVTVVVHGLPWKQKAFAQLTINASAKNIINESTSNTKRKPDSSRQKVSEAICN